MAITNTDASRTISGSDALINGLFSGIIAGLVMLAALVLAGMASGESGAATLSRFTVPGRATPLFASAFLHLGVSAVYGAVFGLLLHMLPKRYRKQPWKWMAGLLFGLLLFTIADWLLLPAAGSSLLEIPGMVLAAAHAIFGVVLGLGTSV